MKSKRFLKGLLMALTIMLIAAITACGNGDDAENENAEGGGEGAEAELSGTIPVYTPGSGGILYILNAGITNIFNNTDVMPEVQLVTEATSGSTEIISLALDRAKQEQPVLASNAQPDTVKAYEGAHPNIEGEHPDMRAVSKLGYAAVHLTVPAGSDIKSFADLEGKKIGANPGSAPETFLKELLEGGYGLEAGSDYELLPLGYQEVQQGLQNNSIDAGILMGSFPAPLVQEVAQMTDIRILSIEEEAKEKFDEKYPYYSFRTVEPGTYPGQDEELTLGALELITFTDKSTPDELVYNYVKTILENPEQFHETHAVAKQINEDTIAEGLMMPLHPGAEQYYKENGILEE